MIITKLIIQNFRSYFGEKVFEFKSGLNLVLGSNGDGKTTFYDALEFVLGEQTRNSNASLRSCVLAKMFASLTIGEKGVVKVILEILNNSNQKRFIERSFEVEKYEGDVMTIQNNKHVGYTHTGMGLRKDVPVNNLLQGEALFPAVIKKYSLFKGERSLNIFDNKTTLQNLINLFSDIKDMEPYLSFSGFAETTSSAAVANALENAEERSLEEFMDKLAESANRFLAILNVDDFTGIIRIYRDIRDNAVRVQLIDKSGKIIENDTVHKIV